MFDDTIWYDKLILKHILSCLCSYNFCSEYELSYKPTGNDKKIVSQYDGYNDKLGRE